MIKKSALTTLVLLATATTAYADGLSEIGLDDPHVMVPPVPETSTDFYVGGGVGQAEYSGDFDTVGKHGETVLFDLDGEVGSVFVGIKRTFNSNITLGLEAQYTQLGHGDTVGCHGTCRTCDVESDGTYDLTATLGYTVGRVNIYGLAGVAKTSGSVSVANVGDNATADQLDAERQGYKTTGVVLGVGADVMITESLSIGVEYNDFSFDAATTASDFYDSVDFDPSSQNVQVRVTYTF